MKWNPGFMMHTRSELPERTCSTTPVYSSAPPASFSGAPATRTASFPLVGA